MIPRRRTRSQPQRQKRKTGSYAVTEPITPTTVEYWVAAKRRAFEGVTVMCFFYRVCSATHAARLRLATHVQVALLDSSIASSAKDTVKKVKGIVQYGGGRWVVKDPTWKAKGIDTSERWLATMVSASGAPTSTIEHLKEAGVALVTPNYFEDVLAAAGGSLNRVSFTVVVLVYTTQH